MASIRVLIVDDHDLFRDGIRSVICSQPDMDVVGEAGDGLEALVLARQLCPDVLLLDINMPGTSGLEAAHLINEAVPSCAIVMLTVRDEDAYIFEALRNGATGYLLKTVRSQHLLDMIRAAARGEAALSPAIAMRVVQSLRGTPPPQPAAPSAPPHADGNEPLTAREDEILDLIAAGRSDKEIAAQLFVSLYTVKAHVRNILAKLHVANRRAAAQRRR